MPYSARNPLVLTTSQAKNSSSKVSLITVSAIYITDIIISSQITSLKIKYNPFAKAFLDAKERSEHQQQISTSLHPSHHHHHHHRFAEYPPSCHIPPLPLSPSSIPCRCCVGSVGGFPFRPHHHALSSPPPEYRAYSTSFPYLTYEHHHEAVTSKATYVTGRHYHPPPSAVYSTPTSLCKFWFFL